MFRFVCEDVWKSNNRISPFVSEGFEYNMFGGAVIDLIMIYRCAISRFLEWFRPDKLDFFYPKDLERDNRENKF